MKYLLLLLTLTTLLISTGCDKEPETGGPDPPPDTLVYAGVKLYDINGAAIGCFGDCTDDMDWENFALSALGEVALGFNVNITLGDTQATQMSRLAVFPLPLSNTGNLFISTDINGEAILKIAVVNRLSEVLLTQAFKITQDLKDVTLSSIAFESLPRKEIHRVHYVVETTSGEVLYSGYGDISICDVDSNPEIEDCF